jgi:hypothetical protein
MGAGKNSSSRRWQLQQDEHGFQHTSLTHYPCWPSPHSHWSATGPRNQHRTFRPENAAEHQTSSPLTNTGQTGEHHRSDRSLLVKLGDFHRKAPHRSDRCNTPVRPVSARKPQNTKLANRAPNRPKLETAATQDNNEHTQTFTRIRLNSTRGSTPPNPSLDLPNRSTGLNKTLGTIGTTHQEFIAKFNPTKTCPNKRNRRNPAKTSSNPRTPKTPKSSPLTHEFGRGSTAQRTMKGSHKIPPSNPQQ